MSSQQRIAVFRGDRLKTSGGLFRKDLIKNKRGKIVSKKKSGQARTQNNLGDFLRDYKEKVSKEKMLRPAGEASKKRAEASAAKGKAAPKAAPAQPKGAPAKPKAVPAKPKAVPKKVVAKAQAPQPRKKKKLPKGYNPITRQPYEKQTGLGYVASGKVNLDNVTTMGKEQRHRRTKRGGKLTREMILEANRRRLARLAEKQARQG
jgi:hypothetical protein